MNGDGESRATDLNQVKTLFVIVTKNVQVVCDMGLQITPPVFSVYPVEEADRVFQQLSQSQINGRAVFRVSMSSDSDAELYSGDDATESAASTPTSPVGASNADPNAPAFFLPDSST